MEEQNGSNLSDSWVTLCFNDDTDSNIMPLNSTCGGDLERLLYEAQNEGSTPSMSRNLSNCHSLFSSPPRIASIVNSRRDTPSASGCSSPSVIKAALLEEALPKLMQQKDNTDWVWDWSSQPTNTPPKESQLRHPKPKRTPLSLRNTEVMKYNIFSWKFLQIFIPSLIVSNLLAFGIGFYIGNKLARSTKIC